MPKVSGAVRRETAWVAVWTVGLTLVMNLVFALIGRWETGVLLGSLLGCGTAIGCFFWLGLTVQKARYVALRLAIFTAPYLFLFPSSIMYNEI